MIGLTYVLPFRSFELTLTCNRLLDWTFFLILDIGNKVLEEIPLATRVLDGFMQAVAVRAAGFAIVPLAALAPAVKYVSIRCCSIPYRVLISA